jgi:hypothetical protein
VTGSRQSTTTQPTVLALVFVLIFVVLNLITAVIPVGLVHPHTDEIVQSDYQRLSLLDSENSQVYEWPHNQRNIMNLFSEIRIDDLVVRKAEKNGISIPNSHCLSTDPPNQG